MISINDKTFDTEVLESSKLTVVDFWAPWCNPCKILLPIMEQLSTEYPDTVKFVKVNIDETELAQQFGIKSIPSLLFFKNGQIVDVMIGIKTRPLIKTTIDALLE